MAKTTRKTTRKHHDGPGLKTLGTSRWYGGGYCGICGATDEHSPYSPLIPQAVRFWDADDGWKVGVLCSGCGEEAAARGPKPDDFASYVARQREKAGELDTQTKIDVVADICGDDLDSLYAEQGDF